MLQATTKSTTRRARQARSISDLYKDLERAVTTTLAIPSDREYEPMNNRAVRKCCLIAKKLARTRAASIDEMLLKIKVAGWSAGAKFNLEDCDRWTPREIGVEGDEFDVLVSLREDLRRLKQRAA